MNRFLRKILIRIGSDVMRVLLVPFQSDLQMKRCSVYHWTKVFVRELTAKPGTHVYWPIPRGQRPPDEFLNEQVTLIPIDRMQSSPYYEMVHLDEGLIEKFHSLHGDYVVDVIVSYKPMVTQLLKRRLSPFLKGMCPPVVIAHPFLLAGSRFGFVDEDFWRMQASGMVGLNVFSNQAHEVRGLDAIRPFLSPSEMRKVETLGYYFSAFDPVRMDKYFVEKPREPITICYAQAMSATFQYADVLEEMDLLYKAGRDVRLLITTSSEDGYKFPKHYEYVEHHGTLPQNEFLKKLHEAHVFIALIRDMEMCSSMLEQMYAGQIGVLPDVAWARSMTPPGYPFLYRGKTEMRTMLRHVVENYWDYEDLVQEVREFIREKFDAQKLCSEFATKLDGLSQDWIESSRGVGKGLMEMLAGLETLGVERITWDELVQFVKKNSVLKLNLNNIKTKGDTVSRWAIHWTMQKLGWVDTCEDPMPVYVRGGVK